MGYAFFAWRLDELRQLLVQYASASARDARRSDPSRLQIPQHLLAHRNKCGCPRADPGPREAGPRAPHRSKESMKWQRCSKHSVPSAS
jgi:hypothetical protein